MYITVATVSHLFRQVIVCRFLFFTDASAISYRVRLFGIFIYSMVRLFGEVKQSTKKSDGAICCVFFGCFIYYGAIWCLLR